jgi:uncharacterized protein
MTFFSADPWQRNRSAATVRSLLAEPEVRVIPQSHESFLAGLSLYEARPDKGYSLVDCISMQTMRKEQITEVLTNDRHFEQEGFRALFRASCPGVSTSQPAIFQIPKPCSGLPHAI